MHDTPLSVQTRYETMDQQGVVSWRPSSACGLLPSSDSDVQYLYSNYNDFKMSVELSVSLISLHGFCVRCNIVLLVVLIPTFSRGWIRSVWAAKFKQKVQERNYNAYWLIAQSLSPMNILLPAWYGEFYSPTACDCSAYLQRPRRHFPPERR